MANSFSKIATLTASLAMLSCGVKVSKNDDFEWSNLFKPKTKVEESVKVEKVEVIEKIEENSDETFERAIRRDIEKIYVIMKEEPSNVPLVLKSIWKDEYTKGSHSNSIEKALGRMLWNKSVEQAVKGFSEGLEKQSKKLNVKLSQSEVEELMKLVLLAIPESHWDNLKSHAGAKGTYQFMKSTAKSYNLISNGVDKRGDVYESSKAAARLLLDNYIKFNRNIDLTLATYNSGKPWRYLSSVGRKNVTYEGYIKYLAKEVAKDLKRAESGIVFVGKNDTVGKILRRVGVKPTQKAIDDFCAHNKIHPKRLRAGAKLKVSPKYLEDVKGNISNALASNIVENVNYPPKYTAVLDIVSDKYPEVLEYISGNVSYDDLEKDLLAKNIQINEIRTYDNKTNKKEDMYVHVVKKNENVTNILRSRNVPPTYENIKQVNCGGNCDRIRVGDKIHIPKSFMNKSKVKNNKTKLKN
jgi:hypothetical protein